MATKWTGFTEDDIKKIQETEIRGGVCSEEPIVAEDPVRVAKKQVRQLQGSGRKNVVRERMLHVPQRTAVITTSFVDDMPEEARLVRPEKTADEAKNEGEQSYDSGSTSLLASVPSMAEGSPESLSESASSTAEGSPIYLVCQQANDGDNVREVWETESIGGKGPVSSLDEFCERQKLMEEQNRQKKQLLSQVIANRKKRTKEEAKRLQQIQDELQKLDQLLSNDVSILRNQIESASIEFMEAQKRYDKAEKEFLDAKLVLFGKLERKELLTEHLCKIIEENELRKARKLSELMDKLELGVSVQQPQHYIKQHDSATVVLAPVYAVDEVSFAACNTLKPLIGGSSEDFRETVTKPEANSGQEELMPT